MSTAEHTPTEEQSTAVVLFLSGQSVALDALAGTGKTETLKMMAQHTPKVGLYLAFNRAMATDAAGRLPMTCSARTFHSLAFGAVGKHMAHRLGGDRMRSYELAKRLRIDPVFLSVDGKPKVLQPGHLASLVMKGVKQFCYSADPEPTGRHLPYVHGIDPRDEQGRPGWKHNDELREMLAPKMTEAWADLQRPDGVLPYSHDAYLKSFERSSPVIRADYLLVDEGQDLSAVMESIVLQQENLQVVVTGDARQQLYEWRSSLDAITRARERGDCEYAWLTQSWRFGPAIAEVANVFLEKIGTELRVIGSPHIDSRVDRAPNPKAILCRSNAGAVETVLNYQKRGKTAHLVGSAEDVLSFAKAAARLMDREPPYHQELNCFDSWLEVVEYVQRDPAGDELALLVNLVEKYGVDTIVMALEGMAPERAADVVVSTGHRAKGRQFESVRLADDFPEPKPTDLAEHRLLYVAVTRAQNLLDVTGCEAVRGILDPPAVVVKR